EDENDEEKEKDADKKDDASLKEMLADTGSTEVAINAEAEIKDNHFRLTGQSNLVQGSTVFMHTYHYGAEDAYLKSEFEVDKEGQEIQEIYGEEGEKIEGPFAHKYTNTKRTMYGAFTYADLELEEGAKAAFEIDTFEEPDDYGDMDIWMEKESVETKDDYYI